MQSRNDNKDSTANEIVNYTVNETDNFDVDERVNDTVEDIVVTDSFINYDYVEKSHNGNVNPTIAIPASQLQKLLDSNAAMQQDIQFLKTELVKINVHLDNIYKLLRSNSGSQNQKEKETEKELFDQKFPLVTCDEINSFDDKIKHDDDFKIKLTSELSRIAGTTGEEIGSQVSYKIIDHIFTKEVLTNYSWTGISKDKSLEKKPFNSFQGIIDVLFRVVHMADNHWTQNKMEKILKDHVLKQAKKRLSRHQEKVLRKRKAVDDKGAESQGQEEAENINPNIMPETEIRD